jgi:hypothetical protein
MAVEDLASQKASHPMLRHDEQRGGNRIGDTGSPTSPPTTTSVWTSIEVIDKSEYLARWCIRPGQLLSSPVLYWSSRRRRDVAQVRALLLPTITHITCRSSVLVGGA